MDWRGFNPHSELDRALATLEHSAALNLIENAGTIESASVCGWNVIVKKVGFTAGDAVIYFEIDSLLPLDDERFAFLAPRGKNPSTEFEAVLKTATDCAAPTRSAWFRPFPCVPRWTNAWTGSIRQATKHQRVRFRMGAGIGAAGIVGKPTGVRIQPVGIPD